MRRVIHLSALVLPLALFASAIAVEAQHARAMVRVGLLTSGVPAGPSGEFAYLKRILGDGGWIEGQNVEFHARFAERAPARLRSLAEELVRLGVDVIVTVSTDETRAAKEATSSIPIVMVATSDPVSAGFVHSLSRPGGNITGTTAAVGPEVWGKRLQLLTEFVPSVRRVALLWNRAVFPDNATLNAVEASARQLHVTVRSVEIASHVDFSSVFTAMKRDDVRGIVFVNTSDLHPRRQQIAELAIRHRMPMVGSFPTDADAGAMFSYGTNLRDLYRRAAVHVDRILHGASPAILPVERPTKFDLVVNLKTAKALGVTLPPSILMRADRLIE